MFTGIIESLGLILGVRSTSTGLKLEVEFEKPVRGLKSGESIAVDGVCLTVAQVRPCGFVADVVKETLKATTLGAFQRGQRVHLERALKLGARLGGHTLSGHVDGRGTVIRVTSEGRSKLLWIKVPAPVKNFCLLKGSIAVNGVSLTLQDIAEGAVKIALVPHTLQETLLGNLQKKSLVNIEADASLRKALTPSPRETAARIQTRLVFLSRQGF